MAYSRVSATPGTGGSNTATTSAITSLGGAGQIFYIFVQSRAPGNTPTDSKGNTYTRVQAEATVTVNGINYFCCLWKCVGGTGGASHTFTATSTGSPAFITVHAWEARGVVDVDVIGSWNTDTAANYQSGSISPTKASVVVYGITIIFSTSSGSSFTHSGDGYTTVVSVFTDGTAGPVGEVREQLGDNAHSYQITETATSPASDTGMIQFAVEVAGAGGSNAPRAMYNYRQRRAA